IMALATMLVVRWRPHWAVGVMIACANLLCLSLNAYHGLLHFSAEQCVLSVSMVLTLTLLIFQWGWRAQLASSVGAFAASPSPCGRGRRWRCPGRTSLPTCCSRSR